MLLKGKYAIITGGSGGIGLSTAKLYLQEGAEGVLLVDLSEENLKEAKKNLGDKRVHIHAADVSKEGQVKAYTEKAIELFGQLDIVFLNAGTEGVVKPLTDYSEKEFDMVMNVNVKGVWLGMKYAFPAMQKNGGSILITSSVAGVTGTAQMIAYTASKHAVIGAMRVAAKEGAPLNIRVNSIHPGPVENRMMRSLEDQFAPGAGGEVKKGFEGMIPLGRYAVNEDIAQMATFLASDRANYITGAVHMVDGGFSA
jgi:NAD(P)-dependent dehydrogenase (short-subunit alcohol dehydrogenase family)